MDLRPKGRKVQLERGSWLHKLLMAHYDGENWREAHQIETLKFKRLFEEEREELGDLPTECERIMRSYIYTYRDEDRRFTTVDSEMDEIVTLSNGLEINIVVDLIVWDKVLKGLWAWDHKTRKNFVDTDNFTLDPQLTIYYDGLQSMGYKPLLGVVGNEIRTKPPTVPALLKSGGLSKAKSIDTDIRTYMEEIRSHDLNPNDYTDILRGIAARQKDRFFKRTFIPRDKPVVRTQRKEIVWSANEILRASKRGAFPRSPDNSCAWGCDYRDVCIAELHGGDISSIIKQKFTTERRVRKGDE
jgi:hypothetical protein